MAAPLSSVGRLCSLTGRTFAPVLAAHSWRSVCPAARRSYITASTGSSECPALHLRKQQQINRTVAVSSRRLMSYQAWGEHSWRRRKLTFTPSYCSKQTRTRQIKTSWRSGDVILTTVKHVKQKNIFTQNFLQLRYSYFYLNRFFNFSDINDFEIRANAELG